MGGKPEHPEQNRWIDAASVWLEPVLNRALTSTSSESGRAALCSHSGPPLSGRRYSWPCVRDSTTHALLLLLLLLLLLPSLLPLLLLLSPHLTQLPKPQWH